jgi:hypothetical protein
MAALLPRVAEGVGAQVKRSEPAEPALYAGDEYNTLTRRKLQRRGALRGRSYFVDRTLGMGKLARIAAG